MPPSYSRRHSWQEGNAPLSQAVFHSLKDRKKSTEYMTCSPATCIEKIHCFIVVFLAAFGKLRS